MKVKNVKVGDIKPYEQNPRYNDGAVEQIAKSIELYGFRSPIIVDRDMVIICGHTRLKAAKSLGMQEVPVVVADNLTPEQVRAYRIADNKLAELATWDYDLLMSEIESLKDSGLDLSLLDFEVVDMAQPIPEEEDKEGETDRDEIPEVDETPKSRYGALYKLGANYVYCGDSCNEEEFRAVKIPDFPRASLLLTEVPIKDGKKNRDEEMVEEETRPLLEKAFRNAMWHLAENASFFVFFPDELMISLPESIEWAGMPRCRKIYWIRDGFIPGKRHYKLQAESGYYGFLGKEPRWYGIPERSNLLKFDRPKKHKEYPYYHPTEMLTKLIKQVTQSGDVVLDLFGGYGSTLLACEITGRKCFATEIEPENVDIIRKRWAEYIFGEGCDWQEKTPEVKE